MDTREELIIAELENRMSDFLKELQLDASKKITEYINTIDFSVQEIIAAEPLSMLKQIEDILNDYYHNTDDKYNDRFAEMITLERISEVFRHDAF